MGSDDVEVVDGNVPRIAGWKVHDLGGDKIVAGSTLERATTACRSRVLMSCEFPSFVFAN